MSLIIEKSDLQKKLEEPATPLKKMNKRTSIDSVSTNASNTKNDQSYCKVEFIWKDSSDKIKEIFLCGEFNTWEQKYILLPVINSNNKEYKIELNLLEGEYQYKFLVNKEWKILENQPKKKNSNGIINNLLLVKSSLLTIQNKNKISILNDEKSKNIILNTNNNKEEKNIKKTKKHIIKEEIYDCPNGQEFSKNTPPKIPNIYLHGYDLNNNENSFSFSKENETCNNISSKNQVSHILYNHLLTKKAESHECGSYLECSFNQRTKGKLLTFICYKPNN